MKIIDSKGKIFGLVNYVDLIFILVIVFLIGTFAFKDNKASQILSNENVKKIESTYLISDLRVASIETIKEGDVFKSISTNEELGKVIDKQVKPSQIITTDKNGEAVYSDVPEKFDLYLKLEGEGQVTDEEIRIGNEDLRIGKMLLIQSQINEFEAILYGIDYN